MDSHRRKLLGEQETNKKDHKKALLIVLFAVCAVLLATHFIRADKQSGLQNYNTDYFIENAIHQHEDCALPSKTNKTFIRYELLGAAINDNGEFEFYVTADGQGYFLDERGNINSSCSFTALPIIISLTESRYGYYISNYYSINPGATRELYIKSMFSDNAYRNWRLREYGGVHETISFLDEAEQYFGVKLDQKGEFDCKFCDRPWFFYEKIQNKEGEDRNLYGSKEISKQSFTFNSNGSLERVGVSGTTYYSWYFGKDDSTIIIKDKKNPKILERFIIDEYKDYEMTAFSEYVQI